MFCLNSDTRYFIDGLYEVQNVAIFLQTGKKRIHYMLSSPRIVLKHNSQTDSQKFVTVVLRSFGVLELLILLFDKGHSTNFDFSLEFSALVTLLIFCC